MKGLSRLRLVVAVLVCVCATALAGGVGASAGELATSKPPTIYVNAGVHKARLGMSDTKAKTKVGMKLAKSGKDNNYEGQTVYYFFYGKKRSGGYDVEMYSSKKHVVWLFSINGPGPRTSKGIRVGSTATSLEKAYGGALSKARGDIYTTYTLGKKRGKGTDFYVRNSSHKVVQINIRNW